MPSELPGCHLLPRRIIGCLLLLSLTVTASPAGAESVQYGADPRRAYDNDSPPWLRAVGKLDVPGGKYAEGRRSHHRENCSATLVRNGAGSRADTIVTAWHCLEFYDDLSRAITFTLLPGSADSISSEVYRVADGGGMHADWAILRMHRPVAQREVPALRIHPQRADPRHPIAMAGYSRDGGMGERGMRLTYDADCNITSQAQAVSNSDCAAQKGASGGAVVQFSAEGEPWLSGVISQGDGAGISIYVPAARFRGAVNHSQ